MLADREEIAVGIFEPGDFAAVGSGPDAEFLILGERKFFEGDAAIAKPFRGGGDVVDFPAKSGALARRVMRADFADANVMAADKDDESELIEADKFEAELIDVKGARGVVIVGDDEADHFRFVEHCSLRENPFEWKPIQAKQHTPEESTGHAPAMEWSAVSGRGCDICALGPLQIGYQQGRI